jgi:Arc/MetJ-type ribon-helix-helix transcriptional regulator
MTTKQIRIGEDCIQILDSWLEDKEHESYSDAIRRMNRRLKQKGDLRAKGCEHLGRIDGQDEPHWCYLKGESCGDDFARCKDWKKKSGE